MLGGNGLNFPPLSKMMGNRAVDFLHQPSPCENAAFIEQRYRITLNCWDVSTRTVGALAGGEAESAEISSDMPTPEVTPTSAKP